MPACCRRVLEIATFPLIALLFCSAAASAQTPQAPATNSSTSASLTPMVWGVKGGLLFSGASSNIPETGEFDGGTGIVGGVFAGRGWPGLLSIGAEALYAKKKVGTLDGQYTFDYLQLPILVRFAVGLNNVYGATVYGLGGTSFDINLKSALDTGESFTDRTRRMDVGLTIGGGVELTRFLIEARYTHGLRSIASPEDASLPGQEVKLHSFGVTLGVKLN